MLKYITVVGVLLSVVSGAAASSRLSAKSTIAYPAGCNVLWPCERVKPSAHKRRIAKAIVFGAPPQIYGERGFRPGYDMPTTSLTYGIAKPIRYIAGRLICAINVNLALAERGLKGTGSALAHSFDRWGVRVSHPVPGAVAVTDRRGGGHVAYVARVDPNGRVFAWNPSPRGRGWELIEYTHRRARYRIAG